HPLGDPPVKSFTSPATPPTAPAPSLPELMAALRRLMPPSPPPIFAYRGTIDEFKSEMARIGFEVSAEADRGRGRPPHMACNAMPDTVAGLEIRRIDP